MKIRTTVIMLAVAALAAAAPSVEAAKSGQAAKTAKTKTESTQSAQNKFRLKPGAERKLCLTCHPQFEDLLKKSSVHTPVMRTGCIACHSPHTTRYPKQLNTEVNKLCLTCHGGGTILPKDAKSAHRPVVEGKCVECHDPHASDNRNNLRKSGNELCYGCHKDKAESVGKAKFKHNPVEKGCINCHNPHASPAAPALLKAQVPALCKGCHQTDKPLFVKQHQNYPVANARCTMCHSVHGSDRPGLIYTNAHQPFVNRMCNQCHEGPSSAAPLTLKKKGLELCRGCHSSAVNDMFSKNRLHWAVAGKDGCLNCHSPHATPQPKLLKDNMLKVCGSCHADTVQRQERSVTKHQPVQQGSCTSCHSPHASDKVLLFTKDSTIELCGQCHDWQKHATHPLGEKARDKRNKNLAVQCLSCHRSHGTEYKQMIPFGTITELCTQCHTDKMR